MQQGVGDQYTDSNIASITAVSQALAEHQVDKTYPSVWMLRKQILSQIYIFHFNTSIKNTNPCGMVRDAIWEIGERNWTDWFK